MTDETETRPQQVVSQPTTCILQVNRDLRSIRIAQWALAVYIVVQLSGILRLIGVPGVPAILLFLYRALDVLVIVYILLVSGPRISLRAIDTVLLLVVLYPAFLGFFYGNLNITFANDVAIFFAFIAKVVLFRTILLRVTRLYTLDEVFKGFSARIMRLSLVVAIMAIALAQLISMLGLKFYYQAPAEFALAAALAIANGNSYMLIFFGILTVFSGKRMLMVGFMVMALAGLFSSRKNVLLKVLKRLPIVAASLCAIGVVLVSTIDISSLPFLDKLDVTYRLFLFGLEQASGVEDFLAAIDPGRFVEYVSLKPYLVGDAFWVGNGYGFRYELDYYFLKDVGIDFDGDVSNAHFTPLAIVAKFGVVGLVMWCWMFAVSLSSGGKGSSIFQYACRLALVGLIVQSFFAFGLFVNAFTPFLLAVASLRLPQQNKLITTELAIVNR